MAQVPLRPLATGLKDWTHGVYCDEFDEFQLKEIPVFQVRRGLFRPTAWERAVDRSALESLRAQDHSLIFDPTEDYETGLRMFSSGHRQIFVPVRLEKSCPVATREHFPRERRAAIRKRSRWVAGIVLPGWERHGWCARCGGNGIGSGAIAKAWPPICSIRLPIWCSCSGFAVCLRLRP